MGTCCSCAEAKDPAAGEWARLAVAGVVAAQSMIFGLAINIAPPEGVARAVLHGALALSAAGVFALAGGGILRNSWRALRAGRIVFDQLFLLGIVAAFGASLHCTITGVGHVYYEIVAILVAIYTFGGLLTETRRREALDAAGDLGGEFGECEVERDGLVTTLPVAEVAPGDVVRVGSGGRICVDGEVMEGAAFVDDAALTGEPFPRVRRAGDEVLAGSRSVDGDLRIRVTSGGGARRFDALVGALREARSRPSRLQRQADRLAAWFLPVVVLVAAATFAFWTWRSGWTSGLFNALAVVLVACPCAMGIATPAALWSALAALARLGFSPRDPDLVEKLASVDTAVFDKTGTLGGDTMEIVDFVTAPGFERGALRARASALESASEHPVARAFRRNAEAGARPDRVENLPGAGIAGTFEDGELRVGNAGIFGPGELPAARRLADELLADGGTHTIFLAWNGKVAGVASLRESLRQQARAALESLERLGIRWEVMTGDRPEAAAVHGLERVRAGLSPEEKWRLVRGMQSEGRRVLFVGDGVNDAAALSGADASIAIADGSALARSSADAELPGENLAAVAEGIRRSRAAVATIRGNLLFAACYNAIGVALAAAGLLHPVAAALIMLASSFTVTWRAMRDADRVASPAPRARRGWLAPVAAGAVLLQGIAVGALGGFPGPTFAGLVALFAAGAALVYLLCRARPVAAAGRGAVWMFSAGGLAMLAGWWADAGFAPAIRDGICLCACADSTLGFGPFSGLNWMDAGMVLASLPMLIVAPGGGSRFLPWVAGLVGMLAGMRGAAWLAGFLAAGNPQLSFFAGYGAMLFGMALGMALACATARRLAA